MKCAKCGEWHGPKVACGLERRAKAEHLMTQGIAQAIRLDLADNPENREMYDARYPGWEEV